MLKSDYCMLNIRSHHTQRHYKECAQDPGGYFIINGNEINTAFIRLSFLGIILFKLLPSINRLLFSMQNLRYGEPIFQSILEHQKEIIKIDNDDNLNSLSENRFMLAILES